MSRIRRGHRAELSDLTREDLLAIIGDAGFQIGLSSAHPLIGATSIDEWCLWCIECGRDAGLHFKGCKKANAHE